MRWHKVWRHIVRKENAIISGTACEQHWARNNHEMVDCSLKEDSRQEPADHGCLLHVHAVLALHVFKGGYETTTEMGQQKLAWPGSGGIIRYVMITQFLINLLVRIQSPSTKFNSQKLSPTSYLSASSVHGSRRCCWGRCARRWRYVRYVILKTTRYILGVDVLVKEQIYWHWISLFLNWRTS